MYRQTTQVGVKKKGTYFSVGTAGRGRASGTHKQEKVRLLQLAVCLLLFFSVLIGKGVFPTKLAQVRDQLLAVLSSNIDFQSAFAELGESLSKEGSVFGELGDFCVEVFGPAQAEEQPEEGNGNTPVPQLTSLLRAENRFLSENPDSEAVTEHFLSGTAGQEVLWPFQQQAEQSATTAAQAIESASKVQDAVPAVGTVLLKSDYSGKELPQNYTMDQLSLGDLETMTPVLGHINSVYGYRDHPINGKYQFHGGVDIGGQMGDPIRAFAGGTVEYVGEDDSYGLYFQLDHGNGVKSFYAHCSAVCVTKGETVSLGQKVAEVGASGAATGPHLHLELRCNGVHVNPIYYIEYLTNQ